MTVHGKVVYLEIPQLTRKFRRHFYASVFWLAHPATRGDGALAFDDRHGAA